MKNKYEKKRKKNDVREEGKGKNAIENETGRERIFTNPEKKKTEIKEEEKEWRKTNHEGRQ